MGEAPTNAFPITDHRHQTVHLALPAGQSTLRKEVAFVFDTSLLPSDEPSNMRIIPGSYDEGVREIHGRLPQQDQPHTWLHLPDENVWIDPNLPTPYTFNRIEPTFDMLQLLVRNFRVTTVHTHPNNPIETELKTKPYWHMYSEKYYRLETALPTSFDLSAASQAHFTNPYQPSNAIISHYGITTFAIHEDGYDDRRRRIVSVTNRSPGTFIEASYGEPSSTIRAALGAIGADFAQHNDNRFTATLDFEQL